MSTCLCLFGGPYLVCDGRRIAVPEGSQRALAFVALYERPVDRRLIASTLWPEVDDVRASGNLRTALWRLRGAGMDLLVPAKLELALRPGIEVDARRLRNWIDRVLKGSAEIEEGLPAWGSELPVLLPGWWDDWVLLERERLRHRMLCALERLSGLQLAAGKYFDASESALRAAELDPLRESAQRALINAYLALGNIADAWRRYEEYRSLLERELGVQPSPELRLPLVLETDRRAGSRARYRVRPATRRERAPHEG